jgi:hypothetical protein
MAGVRILAGRPGVASPVGRRVTDRQSNPLRERGQRFGTEQITLPLHAYHIDVKRQVKTRQ